MTHFIQVFKITKEISTDGGLRELLECFQWNNEYDKQHVCEELADVMNYCILMANKLGVDMEEILLMKLEQNKKKYPVEKCKASSKKYTELIK